LHVNIDVKGKSKKVIEARDLCGIIRKAGKDIRLRRECIGGPFLDLFKKNVVSNDRDPRLGYLPESDED